MSEAHTRIGHTRIDPTCVPQLYRVVHSTLRDGPPGQCDPAHRGAAGTVAAQFRRRLLGRQEQTRRKQNSKVVYRLYQSLPTIDCCGFGTMHNRQQFNFGTPIVYMHKSNIRHQIRFITTSPTVRCSPTPPVERLPRPKNRPTPRSRAVRHWLPRRPASAK